MSVYHIENNVLFIHIPKCAGTSMEACAFLGGDHRKHGGHFPLYMYERLVHGIEGAFKFAFVRNPWDRFLSAFLMDRPWDRGAFLATARQVKQLGDPKRSTFPNIVGWPLLQRFLPQRYFICNKDGSIGVDFVGRFENLQEDWRTVCMQVVGRPVKLPHVRRGTHRDYREYYDAEARRIVGEAYRKDIDMFGYEVES
ncbi:MAG: sulfotransferase family 2 domain-containing protein [Anaerolineae bacterium]|nr:sulfotransferase family 2 domain-containing protein [Anaerolineae bacterium]